jgi:hypothetical protein
MVRLNEGQIMPPADGAPAVWEYDDRQAENFRLDQNLPAELMHIDVQVQESEPNQ